MRSGATAFVRLVTILVMALGFTAMTGFSAGAQAPCQVLDANGDGVPEIVQGDCEAG